MAEFLGGLAFHKDQNIFCDTVGAVFVFYFVLEISSKGFGSKANEI